MTFQKVSIYSQRSLLRTLIITPRRSVPPDTGGRKAVFYNIRALKEAGHTVGVLMGTPAGELTDSQESHLTDLDADATWIVEAHQRSRGRALARAMVTSESYLRNRICTEALARALPDCIREFEPDIVQLEFLDATTLIPSLRKHTDAPIVYRAINTQHVQLDRLAQQWRNIPPLRVLGGIQASKAKTLERSVAEAVDGVVAMTTTDADVIRSLGADVPLKAIPPGTVRLDRLEPDDGEDSTVVFVGTLSWIGNRPGVKWLVREVWPIVRGRGVGKLIVAGRNPPWWLRRGVDDSVEVPGYVTDLSELMTPDNIFVSPLKAGSGIRMKILHALSRAMPVVATPMAVEGLELRDGREVLIRDSPEGFAGAILDLMNNPDKAVAIANRGQRRVRQTYTWDAAAKSATEFYGRLMDEEA